MPRAQLLVVDDEPAILATLHKALSLEGSAVDVGGGQRVRAAKVETPVLMMSGHATIDGAVRATRLGALNFIEKPLNADALLISVETALRLDRAEAEAKALRVASGEKGGEEDG
jgi:two-component system, NtrC family, response regulator AtoC